STARPYRLRSPPSRPSRPSFCLIPYLSSGPLHAETYPEPGGRATNVAAPQGVWARRIGPRRPRIRTRRPARGAPSAPESPTSRGRLLALRAPRQRRPRLARRCRLERLLEHPIDAVDEHELDVLAQVLRHLVDVRLVELGCEDA